jgi:hypothetical protein
MYIYIYIYIYIYLYMNTYKHVYVYVYVNNSYLHIRHSKGHVRFSTIRMPLHLYSDGWDYESLFQFVLLRQDDLASSSCVRFVCPVDDVIAILQ